MTGSSSIASAQIVETRRGVSTTYLSNYSLIAFKAEGTFISTPAVRTPAEGTGKNSKFLLIAFAPVPLAAPKLRIEATGKKSDS